MSPEQRRTAKGERRARRLEKRAAWRAFRARRRLENPDPARDPA